MDRRELGIYIHIPFCVRKCAYCDFLSFPAGSETWRAYFRILREEIVSCPLAGDYETVSVYFGGGTPSLPPPEEIVRTLEAVFHTFEVRKDAEITIECNPGTMDSARLRDYRMAGFNRLSIGLQSTDDNLLRTLGRIHVWEDFRREYADARDAGFDNLSVDLMYGLPGQTLSSWEDTLKRISALSPEHVSAYSLIIEEGTPFWDRYHEDDETKRRGEKPFFLPDEDTEDRMLRMLKDSLRGIGIDRYEISNYARPGRESRHNTGYWKRREYVGFGLGASSQTGRMRYRNCTDLKRYLEGGNHREEESVLTREDEMSETMILGLRMTEGVDLAHFERCFHENALERYAGMIRKFGQAGLLERSGRFLRLTEQGFDVSNLVMCEFLPD